MYTAQANIISESLNIGKGELITEEVFNELPDKLKIKFIKGKISSVPDGENQIIGDSPKEKVKREILAKQKIPKQREIQFACEAKA